MVVRIKAHFDGKTIVPDEPIDIEPGTPLTVEYNTAGEKRPELTVEEKHEIIRRIASRAVKGPPIPDEALRRENMYGDDGR
jgi:hypothetical protein